MLVVGTNRVPTKLEGPNAVSAMVAVFANTANKSTYARIVVGHRCVSTPDKEVSAKSACHE